MPKKFLSAEWRKLLIFNFEANADLLQKYLPPFTQLDTFEGTHLVSLVGFNFLNTKVFGLKWPFHTNFMEVNLRFYVKRYHSGQWRRGVVFISELVSKRLITLIARLFYEEKYSSIGLSSYLKETDKLISVKYAVLKNGPQIFGVDAFAHSRAIKKDSVESFITEHYYGYSSPNKNKTNEYEVEHPSWTCYPIEQFYLNFDFALVYGEEFSFLNKLRPHSVLLAEGSEIIVRKPTKLK